MKALLCALAVVVAASTALAEGPPRVLALDDASAVATLVPLRRHFATELGLVLDTYVVERLALARLTDAEARAALDRRGAVAAVWLDMPNREQLTVTVMVVDSGRTLTRALREKNTSEAIERLALATRELLGTAYAWEPPVARVRPADVAVTEAQAAPAVAAAEPSAPPGSYGLVIGVGVASPIDTAVPTTTAINAAIGVGYSGRHAWEWRLLAVGSRASAQDVARTRAGARIDVGYRVGSGAIHFVPTATVRGGWARTTVSEQQYDGGMLELAASPELRFRLGRRVTFAVHPEIAWDLSPLRVERRSDGSTASNESSLLWGGQLLLSTFF